VRNVQSSQTSAPDRTGASGTDRGSPLDPFIGTAGWSIPRAASHRCEGQGTHLQRYARVFRCAEINSSFHRPHAATTYARWAAATPDAFRFAVKLPKEITHVQKLRRSRSSLERFLDESAGLGAKRGPLLMQLPPSLAFDARVAARFLSLLRTLYTGAVVCEPRHPSWFADAEPLLARYHVARVAADPPPVAAACAPGGWPGLTYYRLHGSPRTYWSAYDQRALDLIVTAMRRHHGEAWCIFDNTASGAALGNAWELQRRLAAGDEIDAR
jgi:uncharacterized protein YecE (DUF72 family)